MVSTVFSWPSTAVGEKTQCDQSKTYQRLLAGTGDNSANKNNRLQHFKSACLWFDSKTVITFFCRIAAYAMRQKKPRISDLIPGFYFAFLSETARTEPG